MHLPQSGPHVCRTQGDEQEGAIEGVKTAYVPDLQETRKHRRSGHVSSYGARRGQDGGSVHVWLTREPSNEP